MDMALDPDAADGEAAITVVVPAYDVAEYIESCLASLVAQTWSDWRCIVVDDGSEDDTAVRALRVQDPRIRLIRQTNGGVSMARNAGLKAASSPMVMFLDGDDRLHPTALARLQAGLDGDPTAVASFGAFRKVLNDGAPYPGQKPLQLGRYPSGDVLEAMLRENFLANGGHVLVRTAHARAIDGFDPRLRLSEDWEFWCRLAARGPFIFIGPAPEVFYLRMRPGSSSGGLASDWRNHEAALRAVLGNPELESRFPPKVWARLSRQVRASHLWEAGRVNFTLRRFAIARGLMAQALRRDPRPKRLALFALAQLSQLLGRSLVSRLRFRDEDQALSTI